MSPHPASPDRRERYRGALLGLAAGDAVGTALEFRPPGSFEPMEDMVGGGPFDLEPGQWTDDTSMALCLAASLVHCREFDPRDQMNRYCDWFFRGYMSSTGECFDFGNTVAHSSASERLRSIASGAYAADPPGQIRGTGYAVDSIEAALWCFERTSCFRDAILAAANLGDDADTTAAICGQVAGAFYGADGIPKRWTDLLAKRNEIIELADALLGNATRC